MPRSLDLNRLRQFDPAPGRSAGPAPRPDPVHEARPYETKAAFPVAAHGAPQPLGPAQEPPRWPSREPVRDGQVSIKAPLDVIDRFRAMCRDDRRTYSDMLGILMDAYEGRR